ncbi:MAG: hypothetical protein AAGK09_02765 [Planctomycetota bacterium]
MPEWLSAPGIGRDDRGRRLAAAWLGFRAIEARLIELEDAEEGGDADAYELDLLATEWALCRRRIGEEASGRAGPADLAEVMASTRRRLDAARARLASAADGEVAGDGLGHAEAERVGDECVADGDLGDAGDAGEE